MEGSQATNHGDKKGKGKTTTTERTFFTNNLTRIMERALPQHPRARIDPDAVDAMDRCVAEFAAMVTIAATEQQNKERRETMSADDLIVAMEVLGYDHYVGPLSEYLRRYRESKGTVGNGGRQPAMAVVTPMTGEMAPPPQLPKFAPGVPPYDFMVRSVGTREMPPTPPRPSGFTFGLPPYDFMVRGPAPAAAVAAAARETAPQPSDFAFVQPPSAFALGRPLNDFMVRDPAAAAAREMAPQPSDLAFVQPTYYEYDFMGKGQATTAAVAPAREEMPPTPPHPSDFTLGLPVHDAMVRGQTPSSTGELGVNTDMLALRSGAAAAASTSRMPPAGDDDSM